MATARALQLGDQLAEGGRVGHEQSGAGEGAQLGVAQGGGAAREDVAGVDEANDAVELVFADRKARVAALAHQVQVRLG
jgi:hypothetical protein